MRLIRRQPPPDPNEVIYSGDPYSDAFLPRHQPTRAGQVQREHFEDAPLEWLIRNQPGQKALCWGLR